MTQWLQMDVVFRFLVFSNPAFAFIFFQKLTLIIDTSHNIRHLIGCIVLKQQLQHPFWCADVLFLNEILLLLRKRKCLVHHSVLLLAGFIVWLFGDQLALEIWVDRIILDVILNDAEWVSFVGHCFFVEFNADVDLFESKLNAVLGNAHFIGYHSSKVVEAKGRRIYFLDVECSTTVKLFALD